MKRRSFVKRTAVAIAASTLIPASIIANRDTQYLMKYPLTPKECHPPLIQIHQPENLIYDSDSVTIGEYTYRFRACSEAEIGDIQIGGNAGETFKNFADAINYDGVYKARATETGIEIY